MSKALTMKMVVERSSPAAAEYNNFLKDRKLH